MRWWRLAIVAILVMLGAGVAPGRVPGAAAVGQWTTAASPEGPGAGRSGLTTLPDGRVLLTHFAQGGGAEARRFVAALYDPATDRWAATPAPDPAAGFAAPVLLHDGAVLVSGGGDTYPGGPGAPFITAGAQRYDPAANRWTPVGALARARDRHTATLLADGTVLIVGGQVGVGDGPSPALASAERFDPQTGQWSAAGALAAARTGHTATLLSDGRVLVVGGRVSDDPGAPGGEVLSAELYDPATGRWTLAAAPLRTHGAGHSATLLADGRVLVAGGDARGPGTPYLALTEIYDPAGDTWSLSAPLRQGRYGHTALTLPDGRILAVGGSDSLTELYDPARDLWVTEARSPLYDGVATLLRDGRALLVGSAGAALYADSPADRACFAETGKCIAGRFLQYWREHGGLAINGYPLGDEQIEILEDGRAYTVQYFERSRLEHHPENPPPYDVLLGQFGRRMLSVAYAEYVSHEGYRRALAPVAPIDGARFFPETGHNLGGLFLAYWEANGGLAQFGYPITEERWDSLPSGAGACCRTQYFERARFEYHPEHEGTPYAVLLGQFGRQLQADNALLGATFGPLYFRETALRERLGAPRGPEVTVPGAIQPFENGLMIWRGDTRRIFVLVGTPEAGRVAIPPQSQDPTWEDTLAEGQEPGGGAAPAPGLYLPRRGIGKLWREGGFRNDLGYATTPDERGFTMTTQQFAAGTLLTVEGPGGRGVYAVYLQATGSHNVNRIGSYERAAGR